MLYLKKPFDRLWKGKNPFKKVEDIKGEVFRDPGTRKTLRFYIKNKGYFLKLHKGIGWREIIGELIRLRRPVIGATDEFLAAKKLRALGVDTLSVVAFGKKGYNPARQKSFIITEELTETESLEDFCKPWPDKPPLFILKKRLIEKVAETSKTLHENGVNHRDYYLCHFLLRMSEGKNVPDPDNLKLWLIDLHRVQIRKHTPERWIVKDLAGLYFSSYETGLTRNDLYRFILAYTGLPLRQALTKQHGRWIATIQKAEKLLERKQRKGDNI